MNKAYNFKFSFPLELKADSEGKFYLEGYACTTSLDRQDEIILKTALEKALADVKLNTTVFYEHRSTDFPVGKIVESKIVDEDGMSKLYVKVYISKTAETVRTLIEEGILNKFSIGGKVLKFVKSTMDGKEVTEIQDMELYEVSIVGLPANIEAKTIGFEIKKSLELKEDVKVKTDKEIIESKDEDLTAEEKLKKSELIASEEKAKIEKAEADKKTAEDLEKSTTPFQDLPLADLGTAWDSTAAIGRVRKWAGGDKRDWTKYSHAFMWYDSKAKENEGSYKLPYADVISGELKAVPKAISSIVGAINGARGGVDIPEADKAKILNQCAKYQKKIEEAKPAAQKDVSAGGDVQVLDATAVMDALSRIEQAINQVLDSVKNMKVEIKKDELPVQKVEASVKMDEMEALIKKTVDSVKDEILKTVSTTKRKGLVTQESTKDSTEKEESEEKKDEDKPLDILNDENKYKSLSETDKKNVIRKGMLAILKRPSTDED